MSSLVETAEYQAFSRFAELTVEKREYKTRYDELTETTKAMQPALLAYLSASKMGMFTVQGYTISPSRTPWVYPMTGVSKQQVIEALKIAGLAHMVKEDYNAQTLYSYIKQLEERAHMLVGLEPDSEGSPLPLTQLPGLHPALAGILRLEASYSLTVRKTKKKDTLYAKYQDEGDDEPNDE